MFVPLTHTRFGQITRRICTTVRMGSSYDIVIVGGGMVGFGLAALTASSKLLRGKRILLLENSPQTPYTLRDQYETRVVALSCSSQSMLQKLKAWDFIQSKRFQPVKFMKVWESKSDAFLTFDRDPLAYIVENNLVTEALRIATERASSHVTIEYDARADQIELPHGDHLDELVRVKIKRRKDSEPWTVKTNLLIGADGVHSKVRQAAGLSCLGWNHGQAAIVATLCLENNNEPYTAWQRFLPNGPLALLPLSEGHSSLVWSTTQEEADHLMAMSETEFVHALNDALTRPGSPTPPESWILGQLGKTVVRAVDQWCGKTTQSSSCSSTALHPQIPPCIKQVQPGTSRARFPLGFQHANNYHAPRVALVGDAAHRILPLAGQGVNLGFGDVISLVRCLEEAVAQGVDLGSPVFLQDYTTERQRTVVPVAATMELLNLLYSTDAFATKCAQTFGCDSSTSSPVRSVPYQLYTRVLTGLRSAGLSTVQSSSLIKNFLMEAAVTGQIGVSPREI